MAFSGKSEQRLAASTNYAGATGTLNGASVKGPKDMGDNGGKLVGNLTSRTNRATLSGRQESGTPSGVTGRLSGAGFPNGPKWKRAIEPGELKPGTAAQAKNTVRMKPGQGDQQAKMKTTSATPKALRGGR